MSKLEIGEIQSPRTGTKTAKEEGRPVNHRTVNGRSSLFLFVRPFLAPSAVILFRLAEFPQTIEVFCGLGHLGNALGQAR